MKKIFILASFLALQGIFAQYNEMVPWQQGINKNNPNAFEQLENNYNEYFNSHNEFEKGSGMKQYQRWKYIWKDYFSDKGFRPISTIDEAFQQKQFLARSIQDNSNWTSVGPTLINRHGSSADKGRVNAVLIDPTDNQIMYVGTPAGGIWKTTNGGTDWTALSDHLPQIGVSAIALSPTDHNTIFIGTGDDDGGVTFSRGVYKSTDGGTTWQAIGPNFVSETEKISEIIVHPSSPNTIFVASSAGIYKTTDGGATWQNNLMDNIKDMRMHPTNSSTIYAVSNDTFYRSTNGGNSFSVVSSGLPNNAMRMVIDVTPAAPDKVYVASADSYSGGFNGLYISNNSGSSFTQTQETSDVFGSRNQTSYDFAMAVSDTDPNTIFIGNIDIWKSTDGGNNFSQLNYWNTVNDQYTHADIHFLRYYNGKLVAGTDGGVYVSSNNGQLFTGLNRNLAISQFYRIAISNQNDYQIYGGLQDNGGFARKDLGWHVWHGADGMDTAISGQDSDVGFSFIYFGLALHITNNGGISETAGAGVPSGERGNWITPLGINSQNEVFAGFKKLYKLVNYNWQAVTNTAFSSNISTFCIDQNNDNHILVGIRKKLYQSNDGGITFTRINTTADNIQSIAINSINDKIWVVTSDQILESSNNGTSWSDITGNLPSEKKRTIVYHQFSPNNSIYVGTDLGVYYKDDLSANWQVFSQNLPNTIVTDLEISNRASVLVASTHGRGIWETPIPTYLPNKDAELSEITIGQNSSIECNAVQEIKLKVTNLGNDAITHLDINYSIDGTAHSTTWNGNLTSNNLTEITISNLNLNTGSHQIEANISLNGDQILTNNQNSKTVIINQEKSIPYLNHFENTATDLLINSAMGASTWQMGAPNGSVLNQTGGGSNAYCTNPSGYYEDSNRDYLYSPCYNFTNIINPTISFNMAFDIENNWDSFYVEYTTDRGNTWQVLGTANDPNWYNSNTVQGTCLGAQWTGTDSTVRNYTHDLSFLTNEPSVIFRFVMASDQNLHEEGVMLDDLQITGTVSVDQNFLEKSIMLYPNPANEIVNLKWNSELKIKNISIFNTQAALIYQKAHQLQGNQMQINTSNFAKGLYFVNISANGNNIVKKLIIK